MGLAAANINSQRPLGPASAVPRMAGAIVVAGGVHPDNLARLNLASPSVARLESWARRFGPSMARSSPTTLARRSELTPLTITATLIAAVTQSAPVASVLARPNQAVRRDSSPAAGLAPPERAGCETGASTRTASREASCESPARRRSWRGNRTKSGVPAASSAQTPSERRPGNAACRRPRRHRRHRGAGLEMRRAAGASDWRSGKSSSRTRD